MCLDKADYGYDHSWSAQDVVFSCPKSTRTQEAKSKCCNCYEMTPKWPVVHSQTFSLDSGCKPVRSAFLQSSCSAAATANSQDFYFLARQHLKNKQEVVKKIHGEERKNSEQLITLCFHIRLAWISPSYIFRDTAKKKKVLLFTMLRRWKQSWTSWLGFKILVSQL